MFQMIFRDNLQFCFERKKKVFISLITSICNDFFPPLTLIIRT